MKKLKRDFGNPAYDKYVFKGINSQSIGMVCPSFNRIVLFRQLRTI